MLTKEQQKAFEKFQKLKVGALFMKQGTGKTRVALEIIKSTDANLVLFFCPFSTKNNLEKEIKKWGLNVEYLIIGYETLSSSDRIYLEILSKIKNKKIFIVADESIFIKNDTTKIYARILEISKYSEYRLILNGTPITKNEWDLYNQINFLSPKIIGMSKLEFLNTFFKKISFKKRGGKAREFYKISEVNIDYLHKLIEPYIFECDFNFSKNEIVKYQNIFSGDETTSKYMELKEKLLKNLSKGKATVAQFQNLAFTCFDDEERHLEIANCLKNKGRIIIFCTLLSEVNNISKYLNCYKITGETSIKEREKILNDFKNNNTPLVMTLGTGAYGLNLQFCNKIAFASLTFDYAKIDQAISRIKRIGQSEDVEYIFFTSNLGICNMIFENIEKKKKLKELLIEKIEEGINFEKIL